MIKEGAPPAYQSSEETPKRRRENERECRPALKEGDGLRQV